MTLRALRRTWIVARAELRSGLLRPARAAEILTLVLAALLTHSWRDHPGRNLGSDISVAMVLASFGFGILAMFTAVAVGMPVVDDAENRLRPILFGASLRPREYAWGKLLGGLAGRVVPALVFWAVLLFATDAAADGTHAYSFVVLAGPALLFVAGTAFAVGLWTASRAAVFGVGAGILVVTWHVCWSWHPTWLDSSIEAVLEWLDPSGYRWLWGTYFAEHRAAEFYDSVAVEWSAAFLASRALLAAAGLAIAAHAVRRFALGARAKGGAVAMPAAEGAGRRGDPVEVERTAAMGHRRRPGFGRGLLVVAGAELRALLRSPGLVFFGLLLAAYVLSTSLAAVGAFDAPLLLTSGNAVTQSQPMVSILLSLLVVGAVVEALGRERACGLEELLASSPLSSSARLLGKFAACLAAAALLLVFITLLHAAATWIQGAVAFEPGPFVVGYGAGVLPVVALWGAVAAGCYAVTRSRVAALTLALLAMAGSLVSILLGTQFWSASNWPGFGMQNWSDLGSMTANLGEIVRPLRLPLLVTVPFAAVAWACGRAPAGRMRGAARGRRALVVGGTAGAAAVAIGLFTADSVGFVGWGSAGTSAFAYDDVDVDLDIDPRSGEFHSDGRIVLRREGAGDLDLYSAPGWRGASWTLDGLPVVPARSAFEVMGPWPGGLRSTGACYSFQGVEAVADTVTLGFHIDGNLGVVSPFSPYFVRPAGAVLLDVDGSFLPAVRRQDVFEEVRQERNAEKKTRFEPLFGNRVPFTARVRITSPADYTFNSVGSLIGETVADGRRTRAFATDFPVVAINVVGARYAVRRGEGAEIYYHPGHAYNIDSMLHCLERGRALFSQWFVPYPWAQLRLSEFPGHLAFAQGFATNIHFSESIGFLARPDPHLDLAFFVTAHELAHQWWGNYVVPGAGPGGNVVSESMAQFAAILLTEACRGPRERIELCKRFEEFYLASRRPDAESPLGRARSWEQPVLYEKGGWVMWMLMQGMGREPMFAGLREFLAEFHGNTEHPLAAALFDVLRRHAVDVVAFDRFRREWVDTVVLPRFQLSDVRVEAAGVDRIVWARLANVGDGTVEIDVAAMRGERFDPTGHEARDFARADTRVVLGAGEAEDLNLHCAFVPDRLVVDPDALVLQSGRSIHRL